MWHYQIQTPIGPYTISLQLAGRNLKPVLTQGQLKSTPTAGLQHSAPVPANVHQLAQRIQKQMQQYFTSHKAFCFDVPLLPAATPWLQKLRQSLLAVPYGQRATYSQLARKMGSPRAARAVGQACARNPFHIIVPCHRIVAQSGQLQGYAGGVHKKLILLKLEKNKAGQNA